MNSLARSATILLGCLAIALFPLPAMAQPMTVDVWTDRGDEAVYQPGDPLMVSVESNVGAHLLVYEIDAEGRINVIFPIEGFEDYVEGGQVYDIPNHQSDLELVVEGPVGKGYIVAIVSRQPFEPLPWYLRPYDAQADALGYHGVADEDEGITAEGMIVGDPFVAMEKIRRHVVTDDQNPDAFYSSYTTYYVHEVVKYPRYVCSDCHRPGHYQWWAGWDPYYATCSAFTFQINVGWYWGPGYWFGYVPRYIYVCNPGYSWGGRYWYSGWYGWNYWNAAWGGPLTAKRYKAPANYIPPHRYKDRGGERPPGFITYNSLKKGQRTGIGHNERVRGSGGEARSVRDVDRRAQRQPVRGTNDRAGRTIGSGRDGISRMPAREVGRGDKTRTVGDARRAGDIDRGAGRQPARQLNPNRERGSIKMIKADRGATRKPAYQSRGADGGANLGRQVPSGKSRSITQRSPTSSSRAIEPGAKRLGTKSLQARPTRSTKRLTTSTQSNSTTRKATGLNTRGSAARMNQRGTAVTRGKATVQPSSKAAKAPRISTGGSRAPAKTTISRGSRGSASRGGVSRAGSKGGGRVGGRR